MKKVCAVSNYLFNILSEMVMRENIFLAGYQGGLMTGGQRIPNLRYPDNIIFIATSA